MNRDIAFAISLSVGMAFAIVSLFLYLLTYFVSCSDANPCSPHGYTPLLYTLFFGVFLILISLLLRRERMKHDPRPMADRFLIAQIIAIVMFIIVFFGTIILLVSIIAGLSISFDIFGIAIILICFIVMRFGLHEEPTQQGNHERARA